MSEKPNGHDPATQIVALLQSIAADSKATVEGLATANKRLDALEHLVGITNAHVDSLHKTVMGMHVDLRDFKDETRGELLDIRGAIEGLTDRVDRLEKRDDKTDDILTGLALDVHEMREGLRKLADIEPLKKQNERLEARLAKVEAVVFKATGS